MSSNILYRCMQFDVETLMRAFPHDHLCTVEASWECGDSRGDPEVNRRPGLKRATHATSCVYLGRKDERSFLSTLL